MERDHSPTDAAATSPLRGEVDAQRRVRGSVSRARALRRNETEAEHVLWSVLRNRQLGGYKFVRQLQIGHYFADFACREAALVVEVDGKEVNRTLTPSSKGAEGVEKLVGKKVTVVSSHNKVESISKS